MGSIIEINDTLQITKAQGFPVELEYQTHLKKPLALEDFQGRIFRFSNKPGIRVYKQPPVRNFLVENINGKWLYWGLCHIQSIAHDYVKSTTSGTFKITYLNTPEEMKQAYNLIDRNPANNFLE